MQKKVTAITLGLVSVTADSKWLQVSLYDTALVSQSNVLRYRESNFRQHLTFVSSLCSDFVSRACAMECGSKVPYPCQSNISSNKKKTEPSHYHESERKWKFGHYWIFRRVWVGTLSLASTNHVLHCWKYHTLELCVTRHTILAISPKDHERLASVWDGQISISHFALLAK